MKYISVDEFIDSVNNRGFDMDGSCGIQCVDGIKKFVQMVYGESNFTCGNGWANGLWLNFKTNGCSKYFVQKPYSEAKKGDWIIWNKGSKSAPQSHVAMFIEKKSDTVVNCFGQSQNGKKEFNFLDVYSDGILGVLRPKIYETVEPEKTQNESFLGPKGYFSLGDNHENINKIAEFMRRVFPSYTDQKALGTYYGPYIKASIMEFQKRAKLEGNYNAEVDGNVGPITLASLKKYGFKE